MMFTGERIIPHAKECNKNTVIYKQHITRYNFAKKYCIDKNVLDLGCGVGYGTYELSYMANHIVGVDIDTESIAYAVNNYFRYNILYFNCALEELSISNVFDVITCFEFIEHVINPQEILTLCARLLKPNGKLIISTPNALRDNITANPYHFKEYTPAEFATMLNNAGFSIDNWYGQYPIPNNMRVRFMRKYLNPLYQWLTYHASYPDTFKMDCQNMIVVCHSDDKHKLI